MKSINICNACDERPEGCWKAVQCGCEHERARHYFAATACPLGKWWNYDLPSGRTILTTVDKPALEYRRERLRTFFAEHDFRDVTWRYGPVGNPKWEPIRHDWAAMLRETPVPFLALEDDVLPDRFTPRIEIPDGCQLAYLGSGRWTQPRVKRIAGTRWYRVWGLLGTHAVLFLDRAVALEIADMIDRIARPHDMVLADNQRRWTCCVIDWPLWYQADGWNDRVTRGPLVRPLPPGPLGPKLELRLRPDRRDKLRQLLRR